MIIKIFHKKYNYSLCEETPNFPRTISIKIMQLDLHHSNYLNHRLEHAAFLGQVAQLVGQRCPPLGCPPHQITVPIGSSICCNCSTKSRFSAHAHGVSPCLAPTRDSLNHSTTRLHLVCLHPFTTRHHEALLQTACQPVHRTIKFLQPHHRPISRSTQLTGMQHALRGLPTLTQFTHLVQFTHHAECPPCTL